MTTPMMIALGIGATSLVGVSLALHGLRRAFPVVTKSPHLGAPYGDRAVALQSNYVALVPEGTPGATGYIIGDGPLVKDFKRHITNPRIVITPKARFFVRRAQNLGVDHSGHRPYELRDRANGGGVVRTYTRKVNAEAAAKRCNDALVT